MQKPTGDKFGESTIDASRKTGNASDARTASDGRRRPALRVRANAEEAGARPAAETVEKIVPMPAQGPDGSARTSGPDGPDGAALPEQADAAKERAAEIWARMPTPMGELLAWIDAHPDDPGDLRVGELMRGLGTRRPSPAVRHEMQTLVEQGSPAAAFWQAARRTGRSRRDRTARELFRFAADWGVGPAFWELAADRLDHERVRRNRTEAQFEEQRDALSLCTEGMRAGSLRCALELGWHLHNGLLDAAPEHIREIADHLLRHAEEGSAPAALVLADLVIETMPGVLPHDIWTRLVLVLDELCGLNVPPAMTMLARMLMRTGSEEDADRALALARRAAMASDADAALLLMRMARDEVTDPEERRRLDEDNIETLSALAELDMAEAQAELGVAKLGTARGPEDMMDGLTSLARAAWGGKSEELLSYLCFGLLADRKGGQMVPFLQHMESLAGDCPALLAFKARVDLMGLDGRKVRRSRALKDLAEAFRRGERSAAGALAGIYLLGLHGITPSPELGLNWAMEGFMRQDPRSITLLAMNLALYDGTGLEGGNPLHRHDLGPLVQWAASRQDCPARAFMACWRGFLRAPGPKHRAAHREAGRDGAPAEACARGGHAGESHRPEPIPDDERIFMLSSAIRDSLCHLDICGLGHIAALFDDMEDTPVT
ncbi:MAG: hypothetical protein Q4F72_09775, partial [Desulfovibrionaceae bacterium]|nr:hypothetical protein [Desulfovibrionaceae bacterium]